MIQNDNIATQVGDTIVFQTVPMLNIDTITTYADSVTGESGIRFFERDFQYSLDGGVTWSDWYNLNGTNVTNITKINVDLQTNYHQLVISFRFIRSGTDNTGELLINSILINGTVVERASVFLVGGKSILQDTVFNDINVLNLMVNLAQKMYEFGIVPAYITRKEDEAGFMSDEDYIDFWQAIAYFYAVISIDSIKFENIYWRRPLLCEFLTERNVFLCDCNDIIQMQLIAQSFLTEMRVRGTEEVFKAEGYEYPIGYRNTYTMPTNYVIQPSTAVQIDGIVYTEVYTLPFGWTVNGSVLVAGDRNYHRVRFTNVGANDYSILPLGTSLVFPTNNSGIKKRYDGEYLRLICYNGDCDEFIYNHVPSMFLGWCLNNASPCYQGLRPQRNKSLLKAYEQQANVQNLAKYPLINPSNIYIGITNNPNGDQDTVMYLSADGLPCFPDVPQQQTNISTHLTVNIVSKTLTVSGIIKLTNLLSLEEFDVPINIGAAQNNFTIDTDIVPSHYSIELNFVHSGTMVSLVTDGAALNFYEVDNTGTVDVIYNLSQVGSNLITATINFS